MKRITRKEADDLAAVAIKTLKTTRTDLTKDDIKLIFGRAYSNILKEHKLDKAPVTTKKSG